MTTSVSELIAQASAKTAKDLNIVDEEVVTEQSGDKEEESAEETDEKTTEEGAEEEVEVEEEEERPSSKKPIKTVPIERFNEVYSKMKQMERYNQFILAQQQTQPKEPVKEKEEPLPDLDELTNKELYSYIIKNLGKEMRGALKEAVNPLTQFVDSSRQERADRDVAAVAATHSDYFDYAEKMMEISNRNPNLTAQEVYDLAKGNKDAVTKSVIKRQKEKMQAKKKANVEKRSSSADKISEKTEFKTIREAGLAMAKKQGLL